VGQTSTADGNRKIGVDPVAIPTSGSGSFAVHAGDHLHLSMFYQSSTQMVNFVYQNETTGAFLPLNFKVDSKFYEPNSGEFITERKTVNSELAPLNNFKTISWNSAKVENDDGNWVYLASTHSQMKDILVGQNRVTLDYYTMAKPGAIGGTSGGAFDDTFVRCQ
jgi:Peptidase A4 family